MLLNAIHGYNTLIEYAPDSSRIILHTECNTQCHTATSKNIPNVPNDAAKWSGVEWIGRSFDNRRIWSNIIVERRSAIFRCGSIRRVRRASVQRIKMENNQYWIICDFSLYKQIYCVPFNISLFYGPLSCGPLSSAKRLSIFVFPPQFRFLNLHLHLYLTSIFGW